MFVEVRLFATLRQGRFSKKEIECPEAASLGDMLERLEIPPEEAGILLLNGRNGSVKDKMAPHDVVSIFPPLGGG